MVRDLTLSQPEVYGPALAVPHLGAPLTFLTDFLEAPRSKHKLYYLQLRALVFK